MAALHHFLAGREAVLLVEAVFTVALVVRLYGSASSSRLDCTTGHHQTPNRRAYQPTNHGEAPRMSIHVHGVSRRNHHTGRFTAPASVRRAFMIGMKSS